MTIDGQSNNRYDAIIVGSGFSGAWAAKELTEAGFTTLLLEAGPARTAGEIPKRFETDLEYQSGQATGAGEEITSTAHADCIQRSGKESESYWEDHYVQRRHPSFFSCGPHLFVDDTQNPYLTTPENPYIWIRGMQVGGRSLVWGGTALRMSANEFDAGKFEGRNLSWPIQYRDLIEPYEAVEELMGIRGTTEQLEQAPDSIFQYQPHKLTPAEIEFQKGYRRFGRNPIPVRYIPPDRVHEGWPRFTMQASALGSAGRTGNLNLKSNAFAREVIVDQGREQASGVKYVDTKNGDFHEVSGRLIFLCCGTIETARLMLNSQSQQYPNGIGNSSGWVGRGLMDHPAIWAKGVLERHSQVSGYGPAIRQRGLFVPPSPNSTADVRPFGIWVTLQRGNSEGQPSGTIEAQGEMLSYKENRVRLGSARDRWGARIPIIECNYGSHEERLYLAMRKEIERAAEVAGLRITSIPENLSQPGENVHELGTARMGSDPQTSVLNAENRCWDCPNVFVTDGSCFPSAGWQNPTLTIMALSVRAGRRAADLLRRSIY